MSYRISDNLLLRKGTTNIFTLEGVVILAKEKLFNEFQDNIGTWLEYAAGLGIRQVTLDSRFVPIVDQIRKWCYDNGFSSLYYKDLILISWEAPKDET
jgi:hypothetical protein